MGNFSNILKNIGKLGIAEPKPDGSLNQPSLNEQANARDYWDSFSTNQKVLDWFRPDENSQREYTDITPISFADFMNMEKEGIFDKRFSRENENGKTEYYNPAQILEDMGYGYRQMPYLRTSRGPFDLQQGNTNALNEWAKSIEMPVIGSDYVGTSRRPHSNQYIRDIYQANLKPEFIQPMPITRVYPDGSYDQLWYDPFGGKVNDLPAPKGYTGK